MKTYFIIAAMAVIVVLLAVLACAWQADWKRAKTAHRARRISRAGVVMLAAFWWDVIMGVPTWFTARIRHGRTLRLFANAFTPSSHKKTMTKFSSVVIASRYLLFKPDTADTTQRKVLVCGAGDRAHYMLPDSVAQTDLDLSGGVKEVTAVLLGVTNDTVPMVAGGALNVGDIVYPAPNGQVNTYVGLGSTGTNYPCGVVVGSPSLQAGDMVEVSSILGVLTSTN